ncbi:MAG: hypothetical protein ACRDRN_00860 [Sciscionella sp.]
MPDPYCTEVATSGLTRLSSALDVVAQHANLNDRYRRLIDDSQRMLGTEQIRLTQARGIAKKLVVLHRAAGPQLRAELTDIDRDALNAGLAQADELIYRTIDNR